MPMTYQPCDSRYSTMRYNRCGRSGLKLPAISLGLWHNFGDVDDFETCRALVRKAFDLGITHFDLANNYGPPPGRPKEISAAFCGPISRGIGTSSSSPQRPDI